jgi:hypothetical protein
MAITWTKEWAGTDDGTIVGGVDLKNIQDDLANVLQTLDDITVTSVIVSSGVVTLAETTTPTAVTDYGKIYTKSDNKLYFQDGAGTEHEISVV